MLRQLVSKHRFELVFVRKEKKIEQPQANNLQKKPSGGGGAAIIGLRKAH